MQVGGQDQDCLLVGEGLVIGHALWKFQVMSCMVVPLYV